ncbi:HsmA family protein [Fusibacter ferrireducens]|uniref:TIGR03987 family protein n=1 Tax=Fusibacter ferrireducens TaxID=2785058 RepID=A0ABR9ZRU8_9FIRM|nr:HsmA family protein [Fusibacter ferrireducens]MBF4692701.1 TIGR03987 family protein [Fusibacter ferrireducens]
MLALAITFITSALLFYTVGVWAEKLQSVLKPWHVVIFWLGLLCDTIGTHAMGEIAGSVFQFNFHGVTGMLAIVLMLCHAVWATFVIFKKDEKRLKTFHKFSLIVWFIWLVPMLSGMFFGMISLQ